MSVERGGGLLKSRAESFARHLQSRLRSLTDQEATTPWQEPSASSDNEYYSIDSSLASPEEEAAEPIFLSVQRSDSGTQYYDTVESFELEDRSPSPPSPTSPGCSVSLKQLPILHLKTARPTPVINGHTKPLDADSGCSRVLEIPCLEISLIESESDNSIVVNNNTEILGIVKESLNSEPFEAYNGDDGEINSYENEVLQIVQIEQEPDPANSFCVFCDIDQIKSILPEKSTGNESHDDEHTVNIKELDIKVIDHLHAKNVLEENNNSEISSDGEEIVPLSDLLQVLKQEITRENEQQKKLKSEALHVENCNNSNTTCPIIEVQESSTEDSEEKEKQVDDEEFDIETKRKSFRRCSSLKTGKTPPGTPGRKKIVRFADVLGLDLANVKTYLDEVPTIPKSAYEDLHGIDFNSPDITEIPFSRVMVITPQVDKVLLPLFQQPCIQPNFLDRVRENNVCLESAYVSDMTLFAISGLVRVKNIDFHKSVYIRYSIDKWKSFSDLQARYVPNSCDGFSDKFTFMLYAHTLNLGERMEFAVRYHSSGAQFWDSNGGMNYKFECSSRGLPRTYVDSPSILQSPMETWASFY